MKGITGIQADGQGMFTMNANRIGRQDLDDMAGNNSGKKRGFAIFAGNLNMGQDNILARKKRAQKEAMKMIRDVFEDDLKVDEEQKAREQHIEEMKKQNTGIRTQLKDIEDMRKSLMEQYGVSEDSQEQKDLELIRKAGEAADPLDKACLTDEEKERYAQIMERGLTQYQESSLNLDEAVKELNGKMKDNQRDIGIEADEIWNTDMARLKKHPMKDAARDAAIHLEAARKEMIGGLFNEAKEHIDEKTEEAKEQQKERAEEKKEKEKEEAVKEAKRIEQEILIQKAQENGEERIAEETVKAKVRSQASLQNQINGDILDKINEGAGKSAELDQEIKDLLEKMSLLQEDLKGAAVDNAL